MDAQRLAASVFANLYVTTVSEQQNGCDRSNPKYDQHPVGKRLEQDSRYIFWILHGATESICWSNTLNFSLNIHENSDTSYRNVAKAWPPDDGRGHTNTGSHSMPAPFTAVPRLGWVFTQPGIRESTTLGIRSRTCPQAYVGHPTPQLPGGTGVGIADSPLRFRERCDDPRRSHRPLASVPRHRRLRTPL